jgi:hypothetical protein
VKDGKGGKVEDGQRGERLRVGMRKGAGLV